MNVLEQLRLIDPPGWRDILEIAIATFAIYRVLLLLHRRRAMQILIGVIILAVAYALGVALQLTMLTDRLLINAWVWVSSAARCR